MSETEEFITEKDLLMFQDVYHTLFELLTGKRVSL